jgi:hypothetical protein
VRRRLETRSWALVYTTAAATVALVVHAHAFRPPDLTKAQQDELRRNFAPCLSKIKGPYTENYCICPNGQKRPVQVNGRVTSPCGGSALFCSAYRAPWAEALSRQRMWIANLFARDLYHWDSFADHHDLVRGYILEKYFAETNPKHKLGEMRAYGGLAGAEYEAAAAPRFFERYLSLPDYDDARHYVLAYELQRRYYVRDDQGQIQKVRALAIRIHQADPNFKPLRDATHNQISANLIPKLETYRDTRPPGAIRSQTEELIAEIRKLTSLDDRVLRAQLGALDDKALGTELSARLPGIGADPIDALEAFASIMTRARRTVAARSTSPGDRRRLVDAAITAAALMQQPGNALLAAKGTTARQHLRVLGALTEGAYGAGLLGERERAEAARTIDRIVGASTLTRDDLAAGTKHVQRVVDWAQQNVYLAFAEVWAPWTYLLPQVSGIADDVLRGSPLLVFAELATRLDDAARGGVVRHEVFGAALDTGVRALNSGLAIGRLRVAPPEGGYARDEIVALPETPVDLQPAAGIVTQGEGNVLSHVQLLARALGIPNVVVAPAVYEKIAPHDGRDLFFLATPRGRVVLKEATAMTPQERAVLAEYTQNTARTADGSLGTATTKLHIDRTKLDLATKAPRDLASVRRSDSGRLCGPKAAFLGELKHLFPDRVARGVVVPFGAYYDHYKHAPVVIPDTVRKLDDATAGESLSGFVARTYATFFGKLVPAKKSEQELSGWIAPRLAVIQHSIRQAPLSDELRDGIREQLDRLGLLTGVDKRETVGCFVRSDTNVEDLDNFNGAGLNLTLFNLRSLDDIYEGLKEVWASPFGYRSFSWRQTLIDEPLWVMPSVVILESIPSEKSGVLVTGDPESGERHKMLVATSEGVGGAVDGTPAETLLWSPDGVDLVTSFRSPWRRMLQAGGSSAIVASTGRDHVLEPKELEDLVMAGRLANYSIEPARDSSGMPRPWDIEFGFVGGKLWLFQCRPFVGSDVLQNVTALTALEGAVAKGTDMISLEEKLQ